MEEDKKYNLLIENLKKSGSVAVAFSAGVDSALLTFAAHEALKENMIAITAVTPLMPKKEIQEAKDFCKKYDINHVLVQIDGILDIIKDNPKNRCYICKKEIMSRLKAVASEHGIKNLCEGSNLDDLGDYRPGKQAITELGVLSPLIDAGLTKADIRAIARTKGIMFWNKPSYACLATRFPCGNTLTSEKLKAVESAEDYLHELGILQVRVRCHDNLARIEIADDYFEKVLDKQLLNQIDAYFKSLGFDYVSLDTAGYKMGNMN